MRKRLKVYIIMLSMLLFTVMLLHITAKAEEAVTPAVTFSVETTDGSAYLKSSYSGYYMYGSNVSFRLRAEVTTGAEEIKMQISSSDNSVAAVVEDKQEYVFAANTTKSMTEYIDVVIKGVGAATINVTAGNETKSLDIFVVPSEVDVINIKQTGYKSITVSWEKVTGCSGYAVQRYDKAKKEYVTIKSVSGSDVTATEIVAEWGKEYEYRVISYVQKEDIQVFSEGSGTTKSFLAEKCGAELKSVTAEGTDSLKVQWDSVKDAVGYEVYRSTNENGNYKKIYTAENGTVTSYTQKVSKGQTYYYYVVTKYAESDSIVSNSLSGFIPKKSAIKKVKQKKIVQTVTTTGQYSGNWSVADTTYYYISKGKLQQVSLQGNKLKIYTLKDSTLKPMATKTVKLGKFDIWGGFYQGTDGCFYVAVGYHNLKENDKKTVIKVYQYDSSWKLKKTCKIKGNAANVFAGVYETFRAGNCRMDMNGNVLYLFTARTMYAEDDGLHHQSNIGFEINTKTMKYKAYSPAYASHSFNQFVKFKDGNLYQTDHGDSFPRAVGLTITNNYGKNNQEIIEKSVFEIKGTIGDNTTGLKIGGMEVGKDNVIICGTSQPHNSKVKGVTGWDVAWKENAYVLVSDRETGKTTVKWLTKYNPKTSSVTVGETRMVKLSDDYFAILYNTTTKKGMKKLNYVVVNNYGKKMYSKTYSKMSCIGASQPILYKGNIIWTETTYGSDDKATTVTYRIPAVY